MTAAENELMQRIFWALGFFGSFMFYPLWFNFLSNIVTIKNRLYKYFLPTTFLAAIVMTGLIFFSDSVLFIRTSIGTEFSYNNALIFYIYLFYVSIMIGIILIMQIKWFKLSNLKRNRRQVMMIIVFSVIAIPVGLLSDIIIPTFTDSTMIPLAPLCILPTSLYVFYSMKKYKLFGLTVSNTSEYTFTSVIIPIYILDQKNNILLENAKAIEFSGESMIGENISKYICKNDDNPDESFFNTGFTGNVVSVKTNSGIRTCEMALTVDSDEFNDAICKIVALKDITDLNNALNKINEQNDRLEFALHDALESSKVKSEFLAKMSHEIRTPMNAVSGMTDLILREETSEIVRDHAVIIKQASENLLLIINDLLDFSKIDTGNIQIQHKSYTMSSLIDDVINITRTKISDSKIRFLVYLDSNIPNALIGDEVRIRQALINVLGNAVKYTDKGYISLTLTNSPIDEKTTNLVMTVEDTGRGIKKEQLNNLFNDYLRVDPGSSGAADGVGLGLAITKGILKAMNGDITAESEYGTGSKFTLTIPQTIENPAGSAFVESSWTKSAIICDRSDLYTDTLQYAIENLGVKCEVATNVKIFNEMIKSKSYNFVFVSHDLFDYVESTVRDDETQLIMLTEFGKPAPIGDRINLSMPVHVITVANILNGTTENYLNDIDRKQIKMFTAPEANVLVVDDIATNLRVVRGLMLPYKINIDLRISGKEAIEAVKSKKYDLVFMDHRMPEMDGVETTERIRALATEDIYFKELPIIALTANAVSGMKEMFLQHGFNDFMSKPIDTSTLNSVLEKWIPKNKQTDDNVSSALNEATNTLAEIKQKISGLQVLLPEIDVTGGINTSGGTIEYYLEVLSSFFTEGLKRYESIKENIEKGDLPSFITLVQEVKSASGNIGAGKITQLASDLEDAGLNDNWNYIDDNAAVFLANFNDMLRNIKTALSLYDIEKTPDNKHSNDSLLIDELDDLKTKLNDMEIDSINQAVDNLLTLVRTENEKIFIKNILTQVSLFNYPQALTLIEEFESENK